MSLEIIRSGLLTTIQDLGRYRFQKYGVIVSGAMDSVAFRVANILVGNEENEAALEMTLLGPEIYFSDDHLISICGADMNPTIGGERLPLWRPVWVKKGSRLRFDHARVGCRAYLAIQGGFAARQVLGSRSTYLRAGLGGIDGRSLKKGDVLLVHRSPRTIEIDRFESVDLPNPFYSVHWSVAINQLVGYDQKPLVRFIRGEQFDHFCTESQRHFLTTPFQVSLDSDRMGYRLTGADRLQLKQSIELYSGPVCNGTIQVPPSGEPIILLADRQTTGGYPKIGYVVSVDLPRVAQLKPGDKLFFKETDLEEAQRLLLKREKAFEKIKLVFSAWAEG